MRILLLSLILSLLVSCHSDVEELTHLHGKTEATVIAELGPPSSSFMMTMKHGATLPQIYMKVHQTYDPADPSIEGVEIKDLRWNRSGFTEAVFMHKVDGTWTVLESCRWKDGIAF